MSVINHPVAEELFQLAIERGFPHCTLLNTAANQINLSEARIRALKAELQGTKDELYSVDKAAKQLGERAAKLEAALSEATWLLREDVPDDPPVTEDEHYARKAAWNEALTSLGIPTDCYAAETFVECDGESNNGDRCILTKGHTGSHSL